MVYKMRISENMERYERHVYMKRKVRQCKLASLILIATTLTMALFIGLTSMLIITPEYQEKVHGDMENAYYSADVYTLKENILKAKAGMEELGLEADDSGKYWSWEKNYPDYKMEWQYKHMDSIVVRCDEMISWVEMQYNDNQTSQQMQDVYSAKMNNIRFFIKDDGGWSDDVAEAAYKVKFYPNFVIIYPVILAVLIVLTIIVVALSFVLRIPDENYVWIDDGGNER